MTKIKILLIAAGESKRMGEPKQLLSWGSKTLIEHQIEILLQLNYPVSVVLGANSDLIQRKIQNSDVQIILNENWKTGMGTSISYGVKSIEENEESYDGILLALVDQPLIHFEHYQQIIDDFKSGKNQIIISKSEDGLQSAPTLFDIIYLKDLIGLNGENGAKPIIKKHQNEVVFVTCKSSLEDIDTPEKYQEMLKISNPQF